MARLFGTDGVRGVANTQLTCDLAFKLGQAAVAFAASPTRNSPVNLLSAWVRPAPMCWPATCIAPPSLWGEIRA